MKKILDQRGFALPLVLVVVAVGVIVGVISYFQLKPQPALQTQPKQTPSVTSPSIISNPLDKNTNKEIFGDISFMLPKDWKIRREQVSGGGENIIAESLDAFTNKPYGFTPPVGINLSISRRQTELTKIECDPDKKEDFISDVRCLKIDGVNAKSFHTDYEGHYLSYTFVQKGFAYSFSFGSKDLNREKGNIAQIESIINSIKLL